MHLNTKQWSESGGPLTLAHCRSLSCAVPFDLARRTTSAHNKSVNIWAERTSPTFFNTLAACAAPKRYRPACAAEERHRSEHHASPWWRFALARFLLA